MAGHTAPDEHRSPLAGLSGRRPPAPGWFQAAIAKAPDRHLLPLAGGVVEALAWGDRGRPGVVLIHGSAAHADIWRPFAPFLATGHRVVAFSWPGMGRSSRRPVYDLDAFADDIVDVATQSGLFAAARRPVMIAHSMGGGPAVIAAARHGARFGGAVIVDTLVRPPAEEESREGYVEHARRPHRLYPDLTAALARFRFAPTQPPSNLYLTDMIARDSLEQVEGGWRWRFDPDFRRHLTRADCWSALASPACPLALMTAEHSAVVAGRTDRMLEQAPPGTPHIVIPDAHHHLMVDQPIAFISALRGILALWG